jgi:hypothetical protein
VKIVAYIQAKYSPDTYATAPVALRDMFHGIVGLSGTVFNRNLYFIGLRLENVSLEEGSLGRAAQKPSEDRAAGQSDVVMIGQCAPNETQHKEAQRYEVR